MCADRFQHLNTQCFERGYNDLSGDVGIGLRCYFATFPDCVTLPPDTRTLIL